MDNSAECQVVRSQDVHLYNPRPSIPFQMNLAAWRGLQYAHKLHAPARRIAGRRYPSFRPLRASFFHSSQNRNVWPFPPPDSSSPQSPPSQTSQTERDSREAQGEPTAFHETVEGGGANNETTNTTPGKERGGGSDRGSAFNRSMRNRRPKEIPPIYIPGWFLSRNVKLRGAPRAVYGGRLEIVGKDGNTAGESIQKVHSLASGGSAADSVPDNTSEQPSGKKDTHIDISEYRIGSALMSEVSATISAGFALSRSDVMETFAGAKAHLKLVCPIDGGDYFLDKVVEEAAAQLDADVVRLDAQDLAEIAGDYVKEGPNAASGSLWSMGYDLQKVAPRVHELEIEEMEEEGGEEEEGGGQDDVFKEDKRGAMQGFSAIRGIPVVGITTNMKGLSGILNRLTGGGGGGPPGLPRGVFELSRNGPRMPKSGTQFADVGQNQQWNDLKLNALLDALLDATYTKRRHETVYGADGQLEGNIFSTEGVAVDATSESQDTKTPEADAMTSPDATRTIIQIRGLKELSMLAQGSTILENIVQIVQRRRTDGHQIVIVGTTASDDMAPELSRSDVQGAQSEGADTLYRTIFITPNDNNPSHGVFNADEMQRTAEINLRHILDAIVRLEPDPAARRTLGSVVKLQKDLEKMPTAVSPRSISVGSRLLTFDEVHRLAMTVIGRRAVSPDQNASLHAEDISSAMALLQESDDAKADWTHNEKLLQRPTPQQPERPKTSPAELRLRRVRKTCNRHEKRLLGGVIDPENLRTTFADVHVSPATIEALKTLTTLSLTRPDAFKYGVLATDKISGLLLYGPPGTGKTLLAKAVAKESGATVLEVSGSDVYDMYVGESEKNVRAIFSLAKKLSPCVVFVDEADAIFASRGGSSPASPRAAHRELINQFLKEWDGMADTSAFVMVATNRPFDLDDAALRRLPRRLLVDLPAEPDRLAILRIHLAGETLDPAVDLAALARRTHLYSGSDLKNVAVAAALAAVREETDAARAALSAADDDGKNAVSCGFPDRRVLAPRHFERALDEIGPSVGEDMASLAALRKFDERYGDRRGRRRKSAWGFPVGGEAQGGAKREVVRVRP